MGQKKGLRAQLHPNGHWLCSKKDKIHTCPANNVHQSDCRIIFFYIQLTELITMKQLKHFPPLLCQAMRKCSLSTQGSLADIPDTCSHYIFRSLGFQKCSDIPSLFMWPILLTRTGNAITVSNGVSLINLHKAFTLHSQELCFDLHLQSLSRLCGHALKNHFQTKFNLKPKLKKYLNKC